MHEFVRETVGEHLENLFGVVAVVQVTQGALQFEVAQIVGAVSKRLNGRNRFADLEPGEARVAGQNSQNAVERHGHADPEPPTALHSVEEHRKEDRQRRPEVVHHPDFERLGAAVGREDRQDEGEPARHRGGNADEEILSVHRAEVRESDREVERHRRDQVEEELPLGHAEIFGDAPHETHDMPQQTGASRPIAVAGPV